MTFETYEREPGAAVVDDLRELLIDEAGAFCDTCGATWDPFELTDEQAAGNDALWHDCLEEVA